ncbi:MAG TPA: DUF268 domain-containing protein [Mucilaginibacter sp.]|nr:DUF268 domain-containing protein [Mucilaginibacter sp.]
MLKKATRTLLDKIRILPYVRSVVSTHNEQKKYKEFLKEFAFFKNESAKAQSRFDLNNFSIYPQLEDKTVNTSFEPHYLYHPAWAARVLASTKPAKHIDISSTITFCSVVSAFILLEFYDYRPADIKLSNLTTGHQDLTNLTFDSGSIQSLSCMHTLEHIGLGRYGDSIDYDGDLKAIEQLKRVLALDGNLLIVVPIGRPKIEFNAHRIYAYRQIIQYFAPLKLVEFTLIPDDYEARGLVINAAEEDADAQNWGCGCFWFKKTL